MDKLFKKINFKECIIILERYQCFEINVKSVTFRLIDGVLKWYFCELLKK